MAENKVNKPQQEEEKKKKKGIAIWWHNLGKGARTAICILGGVAAATAVVVPTVIAVKGCSSNISVELADGTTGVKIDSKKKLDSGDLQITLKLDEGKELKSVDKITYGNEELKLNEHYVLNGTIITINKDVVNAHKNDKVIIAVTVKDKAPEVIIDDSCKGDIEISDIKEKDNGIYINLNIKNKGKEITSVSVKIGNDELKEGIDYKFDDKTNQIFISSEVLKKHSGKIVIKTSMQVKEFEIVGDHNVDIDSESEIKFKALDKNKGDVPVNWTISKCNPENALSISSNGVLTINDKTTNSSAIIVATSTADATKKKNYEIEVGSFNKLDFEGNEVKSSASKGCEGLAIIPSRYFDSDIKDWVRVTTIAKGGFASMGNLTGVKLPNSITTIKEHAFIETSISSIEIPTSVSIIEQFAFVSLSSLTSIIMKDTTDSVWFISDTNKGEFSYDIKDKTPSEIATEFKTGNYGTKDWYKLNYKYLKFNDLGDNTYSVEWNGTTPIPEGTQLVIPKSANSSEPLISITPVTEIAENGFSCKDGETITECINISNIVFPNTLTKVNSNAFNELKVDTLDFSNCESLNFLAASSIANCPKLKTVLFPSNCSINKIESETFANCPLLENITLPSGVTSIGEESFKSCGLKTITIPTSTSKIEKNAFLSCSSLSSITFADTKSTTWTLKKDGADDVTWIVSDHTEKENIEALTSTYCDRVWEKVKAPSPETTLWEGEAIIDWDADILNITPTQLADVPIGSEIKIYYNLPEADYHQYQIITKYWTVVPGGEQTDITEDTPNPIVLTYTKEFKDLTDAEEGMSCVGFGYAVTKITYC